jgi:acyl carrier protein
MDNHEKLRSLLTDVLLLAAEEYSSDLKREDVETWDSLAVVAIAAGVEETFGYHLTPEEAVAMTGVRDIIATLDREGISFEGA